jgi:hypothetical protein
MKIRCEAAMALLDRKQSEEINSGSVPSFLKPAAAFTARVSVLAALMMIFLAASWILSSPTANESVNLVEETVASTGFIGPVLLEGELLLPGGKVLGAVSEIDSSLKVLKTVKTAKVRLSPEVVVTLFNAHCTPGPSRIKIHSGRIRVEVEKPGTVFSAVAPNAIFGVRGTIFDVEILDSGDTILTVAQGKVEASSVLGRNVMVVAGMAIEVSQDGKISAPEVFQSSTRPVFEEALQNEVTTADKELQEALNE